MTYNSNIHSNSYAYGLSMHRTEMYQTTAHEIGHNLNALDANLVNQSVSQQCECNTFTASVMCQRTKRPNLWFCQYSIDEIYDFIYTNVFNRSILRTYIYAISIFPSSSATGFNLLQATDAITSTQQVNSGYTVYEAGKSIIFNSGFKVESGAGFSVSIKDFTDCDN